MIELIVPVGYSILRSLFRKKHANTDEEAQDRESPWVQPQDVDDILDAYTRKPLETAGEFYRCSCGAFYNIESFEELCRDQAGACVVCPFVGRMQRVRMRRPTVLPSAWRDLEPGGGSRLAKLAAMTPYQLLEVRPGVSKSELRLAYHAKLKVYHPDQSDEFFRDYGGEVTKLLNRAHGTIGKLEGHG